jgi:catechol 2,3-dioxygenase-like lactoylglutathione lyase family enzyme
VRVRRIDHVQLAMPVGSEPTAIEFYEGVLGIPHVPKPAHLAVRGGCWFEDGELRLHLGAEEEFRPARKAHPALVVEGLDDLVDRLRSHGVEVRVAETPNGAPQVYVDDPFGNRIELIAAL